MPEHQDCPDSVELLTTERSNEISMLILGTRVQNQSDDPVRYGVVGRVPADFERWFEEETSVYIYWDKWLACQETYPDVTVIS